MYIYQSQTSYDFSSQNAREINQTQIIFSFLLLSTHLYELKKNVSERNQARK